MLAIRLFVFDIISATTIKDRLNSGLQKVLYNWGITFKQLLVVHIQALYSADVILPGINSCFSFSLPGTGKSIEFSIVILYF